MLDGETMPQTMEAADAALTSTSESPEPVTETPAAEPAEQSPGPVRDELGRFTSPAPKAEPEAPEGDAAPAPETPGEPTAESEPEAPAEQYEPVKYRADGQDLEIPGSAVGSEGAFIPAAQLPEVLQLLSAGKAAFGSVRQRLSEAADQVKTANSRAEAAEAQAQHLLAHFEQMVESGQMGQWLEAVQQNWPILKAEAKAKAIEMQNKANADRLKQYEQREEQARLRPLMDSALERSVMQRGQALGLQPDDLAEVHRALKAQHMENLVFVRAPYDDPASGIRQGELVIDYSVVDAELQRAASWAKRYGGKSVTTKPTAKPEAPKPVNKVPPTVGAKGTRAPKQGSAIPAFKSTREADEWFANGGYNDIDGE